MSVNSINSLFFLVTTVILFCLTGCLEESSTSIKASKMPPTTVMTGSPQTGLLSETLMIAGNLSAAQQAILSSELEGIIEAIYVNGGETVKKGQALMKIDSSITLAELKRVQVEVKLRRSEAERVRSLFQKNVKTQYDLDIALTNLETALATKEIIQVKLNKHIIKAPFSGQLGIRQISVGDYVMKGTSLIELVASTPMYVDFNVAETAISALNVDKPVDVYISAMGNTQFKAVIDIISPAFDNKTRSIAVRAKIDNQDNRLKPGLFAKVDLPTTEAKPVFWLPQTAIFQEGKNDMLMVNEDGIARRVIVEVAGYKNEKVAISKGISVDDIVVIGGHHKVPFDGMPIMAVNKTEAENIPNTDENKEIHADTVAKSGDKSGNDKSAL